MHKAIIVGDVERIKFGVSRKLQPSLTFTVV